MCRLFVTQGVTKFNHCLYILLIINKLQYNNKKIYIKKKNVTNTLPLQYSKIGYYSSGTQITHFDTEAAIRKCFPEIGVHKNFAIFIKQQLCRGPFK